MLRLKKGGMVAIFGNALMAEVEQLNVFGIEEGRIVRIERHEFALAVEPVSKIACYRCWTENNFDSI